MTVFKRFKNSLETKTVKNVQGNVYAIRGPFRDGERQTQLIRYTDAMKEWVIG
jgi:hypothetical protein